ncbi:hypothetical protein OOU_Y34scaffold00164g8 [Pyricularia oryzae Y34]|uniref:Uncharacterized protein n=2 Tax=Pyricularia oryzae TaxID=318829 RepID=A0AA97P721_PYRO3|nr:hypothetical protein OOU_Y34scaffold00164g8 [Pyricularia oryzae Y34]
MDTPKSPPVALASLPPWSSISASLVEAQEMQPVDRTKVF